MRALFPIAISICGVSPAFAQTAMERIEPKLKQAIEEHTVFLTCSSLDPEAAAFVRKSWSSIVTPARAYLVARYTPLAELEAFDRRTDPATMVAVDKPLSEAIQFCALHSDWSRKFNTFDFVYKVTE